MRIQLFHVRPELGEATLLRRGRRYDRVAGIFAAFSIAAGWGLGAFAVERVDNDMPDGLQLGLDAMLEFGRERGRGVGAPARLARYPAVVIKEKVIQPDVQT